MDDARGGASGVLNSHNASEVIDNTIDELNIDFTEEVEDTDLVMVDIRNYVNVRSEATVDSTKMGVLYKDCGGTLLELGDEWSLIRSGQLIGWVENQYLLFGEDAEEMAADVGITLAVVNVPSLRIHSDMSLDSEVLTVVPLNEIMEVVDQSDSGWVYVDYCDVDGYVVDEFVDISFEVDAGETMEQIRAREAAEAEARRHQNYGAYMTGADDLLLLAALIQCEAGGEPYEGQVAVGAVVMNRVRSAAYPNTIHGVIYASGQFTPAMSGRVNQVYNSGAIRESCIMAAQEALNGVSNVGDFTHFRTNNGAHTGIAIGNHIFY
ncbi:MAG: cell wall hydrolase [Lachnospiraceae bacterium]|nr:cell wall hydrolase [Lachnospiraceae bacterium]